MTTARTRFAAEPLMRIAGACAAVILFVIVILPH
jgi:hypothetical protein